MHVHGLKQKQLVQKEATHVSLSTGIQHHLLAHTAPELSRLHALISTQLEIPSGE